jgi:peptidoglycan hydrolase-like protein with peptidoglycan-binding domain
LVIREELDGAFGYADRRPLTTRLSGTITMLPTEGETMRRGDALVAVDGHPVVLLYGMVPAWRRLGLGVSPGPDVRQLETNLTALGYAPESINVDRRFDEETAAAVGQWQRDLGLNGTGVVPRANRVPPPTTPGWSGFGLARGLGGGRAGHDHFSYDARGLG